MDVVNWNHILPAEKLWTIVILRYKFEQALRRQEPGTKWEIKLIVESANSSLRQK